MPFFRNKFFLVFVSLLLLMALTVAAGSYFLLFTRHGAEFVIHKLLIRYSPSTQVTYGSFKGTLGRGVVFKNLSIRDTLRLPAGAEIKIQKMQATIGSLWARDIVLVFENGRLFLPGSDLVLFWGSYRHGQVDLNLFSSRVDLRQAREILERGKVVTQNFSGTLNEVDVDVAGEYPRLTAKGKFKMPEFAMEKFSVKNCAGTFDFQIELYGAPQLIGAINVAQGEVQGPKTAVVKLSSGKLIYKGDPKQPTFDLRGTTRVSGVNIDATLKGTPHVPDLHLTSQPPLPQQQLLVMLVTNKRWKGEENMFNRGEIPVDMAADFLDYFAFSGMGGRLSQELGISDVSVKFDTQTKGIGVKKDLSDFFRATYGVEQSVPTLGNPTVTTQKFGGEYRLDSSTTIGVERSVQQASPAPGPSQKPLDQKIMIKIEKGF